MLFIAVTQAEATIFTAERLGPISDYHRQVIFRKSCFFELNNVLHGLFLTNTFYTFGTGAGQKCSLI